MLKLALRNLFRHKLRTALTLAAIACGVAGLILSGGFIEDVFTHLRESTIHSRLGHIQIYRAGYYAHGASEPYRYLISDSAQVRAIAQREPHIRDVMLRLQFSGLLSSGRAELPIVGEGVEPEREARLGSAVTVIAGRILQARDVTGVMLGEGVARALHIAPGQYVDLMVTTPDGALNLMEYTVVGVFRTFSKDYDDRAVRLPLAGAQGLLATPGVHALVLSLDDSGATDHVAARLRVELPAAYEVKTWHELAEFYQKAVDLYRRQFLVLQFIILVMVLLGVTNSVNMAVHERTGEYGTLLALGTRRRQVSQLVVLEQGITGLMGAIIGVALGALLAWAISAVGITMPPPPNMNEGYEATIPMVSGVVLMAGVIGVLAALLAALLPARRVGRMEIVGALARNI